MTNIRETLEGVRTCPWEQLRGASIHHYIQRGITVKCPRTGIELVALHNAVTAVIKEVANQIEVHRIASWHVVWKTISEIAWSSNSSAATFYTDARPHQFAMRFICLNMMDDSTLFWHPDTKRVEREARVVTKQMTADEFLKEYVPATADPNDTNGETAESRQQVDASVAISNIGSTLTREFNISADVAQEYAKRYVQRLLNEGRLTEDYVKSSDFYYHAIHGFVASDE